MLQSQSNNFATMAQEMMVNNANQRFLIKANMEVKINKKRHVKFNNFKTIKDLGVLING